MRSLIGAFASSNPAAFHAEDGSGYQFLVEMLTELNQRNPQVRLRLDCPLIRLKRYDEKRQARCAAPGCFWRFMTLWRPVRENQ